MVARRVLARVDKAGAYTTLALSAEMQRSRLTEKDRRLATEICYGVLRHRSRLDRALAHFAHKGLKKLPPPVLLALRVAAYQLLFLDRVPAHAAVDDAVTEVRRIGGPKLGGFANGLLRKLSREGEPKLPEGDDMKSVGIRHSMPDWILTLIAESVGEGELASAAEGMQGVAPLCVRVNRKRIRRDELALRLSEAEGASTKEDPNYPWALMVSSLGSPEHSQSFAEGLWTVQDPAAQLVGAMAEVSAGQRVLDACAGVGGKTTHLAESEDELEIDAIDLSPRKIELLEAACKRLGLSNVRTLVLDATREDKRIGSDYDLVVLDAPCSGLGVLRRHPEQKWAEGRQESARLVELQAHLLDRLAGRVKVGGHLLYSVCTFTALEGPKQISAFLGRHPEFVVAPPAEGPETPPWDTILNEQGALQTWPHRGGMDAFYAVRLRRVS
jgi:16S rRNA (cytosine967-C5)-methyltransferase